MEYNTNFEILRANLEQESPSYNTSNSYKSNELRPIEEIPHPYQEIFAEYTNFNPIQSKVLGDVLYTDESLVISAPTGSGKTTIFELAIVRLLLTLEHSRSETPFKIVYICPMNALCEERVVDWHKKFSKFGLNAISVTGDSENIEFKDLLNHNLIITNPEKWDCLTRKWRENIKLVQTIKLFMIDEIHFLNEDDRGSTLETIICRMKGIQESAESEESKIRFMAVSATVPNIEDVAEWLSESAKCYKFSDEYRPVKLNRIVLGYNHAPNLTSFRFDLSLNYKLNSLIMQYSHGKPTLIFCATRNNVEITAKHLLQNLTINLKPEQKERLVNGANSISDTKLKEFLIHGIGYHHAGMLLQTRKVIEQLFKNSDLPILVTTSTLAIGVNLPAHLVIIKSTKCYSNGEYRDYSETALLQMIGRAGRPQFDTEATALILTTNKDKEKFEKMIGGLEPIESNLHKHLTQHLNAEVALQTITNLDVALRWLSSTFLYIRARKNPRHYGLTSSDPVMIDRKLLDMCQIELNKLIKAGMLTIDQDVLLQATPTGIAMAKYYLSLETMKLFTQISGYEVLQQILCLISRCNEFSEMYLRVNDRKCLNLLNKCKTGRTIRFPLSGKIKTIDMKVNCLIQAVLGCLDIIDHSLLSETLKTMRNGQRIVKCLIEYLQSKEHCFRALLSTVTLAKCFKVQLWENSPYVSKQLPGIGNAFSSQLVRAGKTSFQLIAKCDAREIEMIINKKPPVGVKILEKINHLPKYFLKLEVFEKSVKIAISLENYFDLNKFSTVNTNSLMHLLVGDSSNKTLLYEKYSHSFFIENVEVVRFIELKQIGDVEAHFISEDWVGFDIFEKLELLPKKTNEQTVNEKTEKTYMQSFMDMYLKTNTKPQEIEKKVVETKNDKKNIYNEKNNSKIIIHGNITIVDKNKNTNDKLNLKCLEKITTALSSDNLLTNLTEEVNETPKTDLKKFEFTPRKQVTHNSELQYQNFENKQKTESKIKWRSPLTYSPPVKFSPKVTYSRLNSSNTEFDCLSTSSASLNQMPKTPIRCSSQVKIMLPLSDKDHADSTIEENSDRQSDLDRLSEFACLENFGLTATVEKRKSQIKTPNEYYRFLTQMKENQGEKNELNSTRDSAIGSCASRLQSFSSRKKDFSNKEVETQSHYFLPPTKPQLPRKRSFSDSSINQRFKERKTYFSDKESDIVADEFLNDFNELENPFDDSLESALKNYSIPTPNQAGSLSRQSSRNFDLEENQVGNEKEQFFAQNLCMPQNQFDFDSRRVEANRFNPQQNIMRADQQEQFLRSNELLFNFSNYGNHPVRQIIPGPVPFQAHPQTPYRRNDFMLNRFETPVRNSGSDSGFNESYHYLRNIMEKENDYLGNNSQVNYLERQRFPPPICTPQRSHYSNYPLFYENERMGYQPNFGILEERPRYAAPEAYPFSSPRVNPNCYYRPTFPCPGDKNYLMQRFLTEVEPNIKFSSYN